jgi:glycosyltransferase involved in cell wall biosynthesis
VAEAKRLLILTRDRAGAPFRQRVQAYLGPLAAHGIACEVEELAKLPWPRRMQLRRAGEFDGILLHRKTMTAWDARGLGAARRVIYDFDDAVMFQARSPHRPHAGRLRRFERTVTRADLVLAGNPNLAEHTRRIGARHVEVIPTGLDTGRYRPKRDYDSPGPVRLVWIGSRSTLKQLIAFRPALEQIGRAVAGIMLRVIADAKLDIPGLAVENVPWRLETETDLLAESDIGIAPLPDTPYTRGKCGFKIVHYMAARLPVVASPVGVNADYVRDGRIGFRAQSPDEWIERVQRLASDSRLREQMGRAGRRRAEAEFDFSVLAPRVCNLIEEVLR